MFDLDDTLVDHRRAGERALRSIVRILPSGASRALPVVSDRFRDLFRQVQKQVLEGSLAARDATSERIRRWVASFGGQLSGSESDRAAARYWRVYFASLRPIDGAAWLLADLGPHAQVAVVSDNYAQIVRRKLKEAGLAARVDLVVSSEDAHASKPNPAIFREALYRAQCDPDHAVSLGDSWIYDVKPSLRAGIPAVWFNPAGAPAPTNDRVPEIRSLKPTRSVTGLLLGLAGGTSIRHEPNRGRWSRD